MRKRFASIVVCALVAAAAAPARGATPDAATLSDADQTVTWEGTVSSPFPFFPDGSVLCAAGLCDVFRLTVALGHGFWGRNGKGAVEVTVRWTDYRIENDLDLFVYDSSGSEIARSAGLDSNAESVFLRNLPDGTYSVQVAPSGVADPPPSYRGIAQVEFDPAPGRPVDLLPNLVPLKPGNFHVSSAANLLPFPENPFLSCYPEETIEDEAHPTKCLRFDQTIANVGSGRLELRFDASGIASADESAKRMVQRIYRTRGSRDRLADTYEFHAAHGHVHYRGFGQSLLYPYAWGTGRTGGPIREGNKVGFCVVDVLLLEEAFGSRGNGPRNYAPPTCLFPTQDEEGNDSGTWMVQGVDVGWADLYGWNLADQFIDITGVPDGVYDLEQIANPTGSVLESSYDDNLASAVICIDGDTVTEVASPEQAAACS